MTRGQHMAAARKKAGLTQEQLSAKAGLHRVTLARLECGDRQGLIGTLEILADALGISVDEYVGHEVRKPEDDGCELYVKYEDGTPVAYAYGPAWMAMALYMDDVGYDTEDAARAAWERSSYAHK